MSDLNKYANSGSISGFDTITTDQSGTSENITPAYFSRVRDIQSLLALRTDLDPVRLNALAQQIDQHLNNLNNPHEDNETNIGINVFNDLYNYWLALGSTGTITDFAAIIYQNITIASVSDIINNVGNALVNVTGANALVAFHNSDITAHQALLDIYLPGTVPSVDAAYSINATIGVPDINVSAENTNPVTYIDASGTLMTALGQTPVVDYMTGLPLFSVWNGRTNLIEFSDPLANTSATLLGLVSVTIDKTTLTPDNTTNSYVLQELTGSSIKTYSTPVSIVSGDEYTDSIFIYPKVNTGYAIFSLNDGTTTVGFSLDLVNNTTTNVSNGVYVYVYPLPSGWIRIGLQYLAQHTNAAATLSLGYSLTPTLTAYTGSGSLLLGVWGIMHDAAAGVAPFIYTNGSSASTNDARYNISVLNTAFNTTSGMMTIRYTQSPSLVSNVKTLFQSNDGIFSIVLSNDTISTTYIDTSSVVHNSTVVTSYAPQQDNSISVSYSPNGLVSCTPGIIRNTSTVTSSDINSPMLTFYVGAIDGYVDTISLYAVSDTGDNLEFIGA
jgi:hypothetical protein